MAYIGRKMSYRAHQAYENGEKPLSKRKKDEILDLLSQESELDFTDMTLPMLKEFFLIKSGWHHTGKFCNCTDFYSIDFDLIDGLDLKTVKAWQLEKNQKRS